MGAEDVAMALKIGVSAGLRQSPLRLVGPELVYGSFFKCIGYDEKFLA